MSDFHETLPCAEDAGLPRDVYELQTAYALISQNDTLNLEIIDVDNSREGAMTDTRKGLSRTNKADDTNTSCSERKCLQKKAEEDVFEQGDSSSEYHRVYSTQSRSSIHVHDSLFTKHMRTSPFYESENNNRSKRKSQKLSKTTNTIVEDLRSGKSRRDGDAAQKSKHVLVQNENILTDDRNAFFESGKDVSEITSTSLSTSLPVTSGTKTCLVNSDSTNDKDGSRLIHRNNHPTKPERETGRSREVRRKNHNAHLFSRSAELDETSKTTVIGQSSVTKPLTKFDTEPMKLPSQHTSRGRNLKNQPVDYEHSSDVYFSVCFKCQKQEKNIPATSYCLKCAYYMCDRCLRHHDRVKLKKDHQVMKGNRMPGSFTVKKFEVERSKSEMCSLHSGRSVKNFCLDHNVLCCSMCCESDHTACRLQSLDDLLIQTPDIRKLKMKTSESSKLKLNSLVQLHRTLKSKKTYLDTEKDGIVEDVKGKTLLMIEKIKKLETQFIDLVNKTYETKQSELDEDVKECENYINVISKDVQYLDEPKGQKEAKLKTVERVKQIETLELPKSIQNKILNSETEMRKLYEFQLNEELFNKIAKAASFGELVDDETDRLDLSHTVDAEKGSSISDDNFHKEEVSKHVSEYRSMSGWVEGDVAKSTCFTAVELLDDGSFLVSDLKNRKLKWFDSDISMLIHSLKVSSEPWGIAKLCRNKYIVTLPMESSYQEVDITGGELNFCRKINIGLESTCVVQTENMLLFAGIDVDRPKLILTDLDGGTKDSVLTQEQLRLFKRPNHLFKSLSNPKIVFVSDVDTGVVAIDLEKRDILFHYRDKALRCVMGLTMTENGYIFICSQQTHCLQCITSDGQYICSVAMDTIPDMREPQCIRYLPHQDEFLLTSDRSYSLVRFKLNDL